MSVYVFAEGSTEERVLQGLKRVLPDLSLYNSPGKGKDQVNRQMADTLAPLLQRADPIRCLVLRDLDAHVGETVAGIVQSVGDALNKILSERVPEQLAVTLQQHPNHASVYTLALPRPDLRLALHIATHRWRVEFIKATIDDYVLALAVQPTTASALIARKGWPTTAEHLLRKVTEDIPGLLNANGIPLHEAKDYVRLYAAVIQEHTSPPVFAERTLAHADETDLRRVLAPLLTAIEFVRS
jgi:hypothetical protein